MPNNDPYYGWPTNMAGNDYYVDMAIRSLGQQILPNGGATSAGSPQMAQQLLSGNYGLSDDQKAKLQQAMSNPNFYYWNTSPLQTAPSGGYQKAGYDAQTGMTGGAFEPDTWGYSYSRPGAQTNSAGLWWGDPSQAQWTSGQPAMYGENPGQSTSFTAAQMQSTPPASTYNPNAPLLSSSSGVPIAELTANLKNQYAKYGAAGLSQGTALNNYGQGGQFTQAYVNPAKAQAGGYAIPPGGTGVPYGNDGLSTMKASAMTAAPAYNNVGTTSTGSTAQYSPNYNYSNQVLQGGTGRGISPTPYQGGTAATGATTPTTTGTGQTTAYGSNQAYNPYSGGQNVPYAGGFTGNYQQPTLTGAQSPGGTRLGYNPQNWAPPEGGSNPFINSSGGYAFDALPGVSNYLWNYLSNQAATAAGKENALTDFAGQSFTSGYPQGMSQYLQELTNNMGRTGSDLMNSQGNFIQNSFQPQMNQNVQNIATSGLPNQELINQLAATQIPYGTGQQEAAAGTASQLAQGVTPQTALQGQTSDTLSSMLQNQGLTPEYVAAMRQQVLEPSMEALMGNANQRWQGQVDPSSGLAKELQRRQEEDFNDSMIRAAYENQLGTLGLANQTGSSQFGQGLNLAQLQSALGQQGIGNALSSYGMNSLGLDALQTAQNLAYNPLTTGAGLQTNAANVGSNLLGQYMNSLLGLQGNQQQYASNMAGQSNNFLQNYLQAWMADQAIKNQRDISNNTNIGISLANIPWDKITDKIPGFNPASGQPASTGTDDGGPEGYPGPITYPPNTAPSEPPPIPAPDVEPNPILPPDINEPVNVPIGGEPSYPEIPTGEVTPPAGGQVPTQPSTNWYNPVTGQWEPVPVGEVSGGVTGTTTTIPPDYSGGPGGSTDYTPGVPDPFNPQTFDPYSFNPYAGYYPNSYQGAGYGQWSDYFPNDPYTWPVSTSGSYGSYQLPDGTWVTVPNWGGW